MKDKYKLGGIGEYGQWVDTRTDSRIYNINDHLGSTRLTLDQTGVIKTSYDYYSYGQISQSYINGASNDKYKFTGKERDNESGYDYFGARLYDSERGGWLSIDPLSDKYPGWSPYNYCLNNPILNIDPDGSFSMTTQSDGSNLYRRWTIEGAKAWLKLEGMP